MNSVNNWSEDQINKTFEDLGLYPGKISQSKPVEDIKEHSSRENVVVVRLSDNSIPLPTGRLTDANMEKFSR